VGPGSAEQRCALHRVRDTPNWNKRERRYVTGPAEQIAIPAVDAKAVSHGTTRVEPRGLPP
jgi:hypothetical protein